MHELGMIKRARRAYGMVMLAALALAPTDAASNAEALSDLGLAPSFALTDQNGKPLALADLRGKVVAVNFIYTACPDICPLLTQKLIEVQDALGDEFGRSIVFVSITLDPERDTVDVLKDYAAFWEAKPGWSFLTGPPDTVREAVRRYGIFAAKSPEGFIDHTELTSIIDPRGELRVQYLGNRFDPVEFRRDLLSLVASR